jgi:ubiquitin-activating enzyme E1 C
MLMNNYTMFNDIEGIYMYTFPAEKKDDCPICSNVPRRVQMSETAKFQELVDLLVEN